MDLLDILGLDHPEVSGLGTAHGSFDAAQEQVKVELGGGDSGLVEDHFLLAHDVAPSEVV
ncbi:hypothetical protein D3C77_697840 [compost metagenome]